MSLSEHGRETHKPSECHIAAANIEHRSPSKRLTLGLARLCGSSPFGGVQRETEREGSNALKRGEEEEEKEEEEEREKDLPPRQRGGALSV